MANYCPNCGANVDSNASFCPNCGTALNGNSYANSYANQSSSNTASSNAENILGTLVAVNLIGGLTRQLYYYNGRYFLDPYCRRPFGCPHMIIGRHRPIGMRPMLPHTGMHGPMRHHGGLHGGGRR